MVRSFATLSSRKLRRGSVRSVCAVDDSARGYFGEGRLDGLLCACAEDVCRGGLRSGLLFRDLWSSASWFLSSSLSTMSRMVMG